MANLNLSEFTEKLFVADADHTFIWDTAASISKRVSRNSWLNSGTLTSDAPVTISQTWGTTGTYTAFKVVATETLGAAAASNLLELWSGNAATLKAYVSKAGHYVSNNLVNNDVFSNGRWLIKAQASNIGLSWSAGGSGGTTLFNGSGTASLTGDTFNVSVLGFSTSPTASASDTILLRDGAANTLALRNGETNQKFHVYATYSNASNYRRCVLGSFDGANFDIQTEGLGTGAAGGALNFGTAGARRMTITTAGNVGIGTTSPTSKLHVAGDGLITGTVGIGDTGTSLKQFVIAGQAISNSLYLSAPQYIGLNAPIVALMNGGVRSAMWDCLTGITLTASSYYGFGSHETDAGFAADTILRRDGEPYHLATRNGTNGQKFSVYGTYPGAAWERFTITAPTSGNVLLGTYKGTGGIARGLEFQTDGVTRMTIAAAGSVKITGTFNTLSLNIGETGNNSGFGDFSANAIAVWANGAVGALIGRGGGYSGMRIGSDGMYRFSDTVTPSSGVSAALALNAAGVVEVNNGTAAAFRDLRVRSVIEQPPASITPTLNGDLVVEATSNTTLTFKLKGTDGTVRTGTITLA